MDPELKMNFAQAGVTWDHLKDKRTSKKIFETIEKQGGREALLKETKELVPGCTCINEQDCQTLRTKDRIEDQLAVPALISKPQGSLHREIPSAPPGSPSKMTSRHNLILNMKEVQLKKAKSDDQLISLNQDVLICEIGKGAQLKPVTWSLTSLQPSCDGRIVAELKDVLQKRHEAMHVSDEDSDSENGDEWADENTTLQEKKGNMFTATF